MYQRLNNHYHRNPYGPAHPHQYEYYTPYQQGMQTQQPSYPYPNEPAPPPPSTPFEQYAKPAQPQNWPAFMQQNPNFYPEQQEQQQSNSLIAYFQDQNGQVDFGKMLSTVNQVATTWQQVTPVVQQINSIIKTFR